MIFSFFNFYLFYYNVLFMFNVNNENSSYLFLNFLLIFQSFLTQNVKWKLFLHVGRVNNDISYFSKL